MLTHWAKFPPVAISVARYLGIKPDDPHAADDELKAFISDMPKMKRRIAGRPQ